MYLFSNHAISLDGRLGPDHERFLSLGGDADHRRMRAFRDEADAVLVGGRTLRCWPHPSLGKDEGRPLWNAVMTRRGLWGEDGISPSAWHERWAGTAARLLVLGGPQPDVEVPWIGHASPSLSWALDELRARGCERVLLEGGGDLVRQALDAGLLDEMRLTICPLLLGGALAPTLFPGAAPSWGAWPRLRLLSSEEEDGHLFLRFAVRPSG